MAFLQFQDNGGNGNEDVHWGRSDLAGVPFRGNEVPLLKDEEYEGNVERVADCKFGTFDTSNPSQTKMGRTYQEVLAGIAIDWMKLLHREHMPSDALDEQGAPKMFVYIEWLEPFDELKGSSPHRIANLTGEHDVPSQSPNGMPSLPGKTF
jgi:hypothetical protein